MDTVIARSAAQVSGSCACAPLQPFAPRWSLLHRRPLRCGKDCLPMCRNWRCPPSRLSCGICFAKAAAQQDAPTPNPKFSKQDLRRIKTQGPSIDDLVVHHTVVTQERGEPESTSYHFVPYEVLNTQAEPAEEPNWYNLPQMSFMELHAGLQERNWTSTRYNPNAEKWDVQFWEDSGRFMRPSFAGYRALVTKADGSQCWVNLPTAGQWSFLKDYMSGGSKGGMYIMQREGPQKEALHQYGYNQVFEEIFAAYEQKVPQEVMNQFEEHMWTDKLKAVQYHCPADAHLSVSYHLTPPELSLAWFWRSLPAYLFYGFAVSFLIICLILGLFKPKRQMPSDYAQAMEFARSKGKARREGMTNVRFPDVAGIDTVREELMEIVNFLKNPEDDRWKKLGAKPPKGVLLEGPPGTGKTLIAKAVAGEAGVPFYQMSGSEFVEIIVGVGAARIRDLFKRARVNAPCIIFVDEIDALGIKRADVGTRTNEEREQTLNQLLTEIDGFEVEKNPVVFMAATNRADLLDPALLRAGRFDRKVRVLKPDTQGRYDILKVHARRRARHLAITDEELYQVAQDLPGLSGAELENIMNEAALEAIRCDSDSITKRHMYSAVDRVLQGVRRPPLPDHFAVKRAMAVHEVGRGIVAEVLRRKHGRLERVERVSMIPRGSYWTRTLFLRGDDEQYTMTTRGRILDRLRVILAGRAAEHVLCGVPTTYATRDLQDAAQLAEKYVANYGLSDAGITSYAPAHYSKGWGRQSYEVAVDNIDEDLFGRGIPGGMFQPSDAKLERTKKKVMQLVLEAYQECMLLLSGYKSALEAASQELMDKEQLMGDALGEIIDRHPPQPVDKSELLGMDEAFEVATGGSLSSNGSHGVVGGGPHDATHPPSSSQTAVQEQTQVTV